MGRIEGPLGIHMPLLELEAGLHHSGFGEETKSTPITGVQSMAIVTSHAFFGNDAAGLEGNFS